MKKIIKVLSVLSIIVFVGAGCSDSGNVEDKPLQNTGAPVSVGDDKVDETVVVKDSDSDIDDHHEGEDDIAPHGHDADSDIDDHHEGGEGVMPHGHGEVAPHDDTGLPPHRD